MQRVALVTGASSGIGYAIVKSLLELDFKVIGISRSVTNELFNHENFEAISCNLIDATKDVTNSFIFKVVSDHFEPKTVTKDMAKKFIFNQIDEIMKRVIRCKE